jgi:hypothetical protein
MTRATASAAGALEGDVTFETGDRGQLKYAARDWSNIEGLAFFRLLI